MSPTEAPPTEANSSSTTNYNSSSTRYALPAPKPYAALTPTPNFTLLHPTKLATTELFAAFRRDNSFDEITADINDDPPPLITDVGPLACPRQIDYILIRGNVHTFTDTARIIE
jgi:hypothetical protein